jgi:uncharacterized membrane protein
MADALSLEKLRANPEHWNVDGSYNCAEDPRLIVRDRANVGWTLNMAHRRARLLIWSTIAAIIVGLVVLTIAVRG